MRLNSAANFGVARFSAARAAAAYSLAPIALTPPVAIVAQTIRFSFSLKTLLNKGYRLKVLIVDLSKKLLQPKLNKPQHTKLYVARIAVNEPQSHSSSPVANQQQCDSYNR